MKKVIISLLALSLIMIFALTSCRWFKTEKPHKCESLCAECGGCLDAECRDFACAEKCEGHIPPHKCEHICEECDGCLDAECKEDSCTEKCSCHNKDTLCPECGGCIDNLCTYEGCNVQCSCERFVNVSEELTEHLASYLCPYVPYFDIVFPTTAKKINFIKDGGQALHVTFDSVDTYYVAAYYFGEHYEHKLRFNKIGYSDCPVEYTWVRFDTAEEITAYYNNRKIAGAFVIWNVSSVTDITSENAKVPNFIMYGYVNFISEGNVKVPDIPNRNFIYINRNATNINDETIYHNENLYTHRIVTIDCYDIDNKDHLVFILYTVYTDGWRYDENLEKEFGEYYEELMAVMDTERYNVEAQAGYIMYCGIITVEDFAEVIKTEQ